jgi:hypothetical protein
MAIDLMDFMHGAALVQIANHKQFTALNKGSAAYGHYKINGDRHLFIKYSSSDSTTFRFSFAADEKRRIKHVRGASAVYAVLVCGSTAFAAVNRDDLKELLSRPGAEQVAVIAPPGKQLRIQVAGAEWLIPRSAFPASVLP